MNMPKISIIVPVYNVERYLTMCLDSLVHQTLEDIEIICVDDGSTDNSRKIIEEYAAKDVRIKPLILEKNMGICVARKRGVLAAEGDYILFCDGDDEFSTAACQTVWEEIQREPVDILHFGTKVNFCNEYPKEQKDGLLDILKPHLKLLYKDLCKKCFHEHKFGHTLWNKAYSASICKRAFTLVADEHIVVSEDIYTFFILSCLAQSYRGIKEKLYVYNYGVGVTGHTYLNFEQFKKQCGALDIIPLMEKFLQQQQSEKVYYTYYQEIRKNIIDGVMYQWRKMLTLSESFEGYNLLVEKLGASTVVSELASNYWNEQPELLKKVTNKDLSHRGGKPVRKLGVYYHRMRNGGAEKVISQLLVIWKNLGYDIVLFTDEEPTDEDYPVGADITRIVLPSFKTSIERKYKKRARYWEAMIKKHEIDTMLYNSSTCHILLWDTLLIKGLGCNLIVETHSMFAGAMWYSPVYASYLPLIYRMVDCVVSLSRVDVAFWGNYCPAYYIQNPFSLISREEMSLQHSKNVLWVGRLSDEKQPLDILRVFEIVLKRIPEATLTIVGEGDSDEWLNRLENLADELKIRQHIDLCGFQMDVAPYYKNASVFAFTSMCEAAPVVLSESKSYGIPIVMYDLPNVEFARDERGIKKVPQNDILAMANNIIMLLENEEERKRLGGAARESIENFAEFNVASAWKQLFCNVERGIVWNFDENIAIMLDLLFENVSRGLKTINIQPGNFVCDNIRCQQNEEILNRHEEVVNRHEEVVNRHEEVVNRHEDSINHQWEVQKWHEERLRALEENKSLIRRILRHLK